MLGLAEYLMYSSDFANVFQRYNLSLDEGLILKIKVASVFELPVDGIERAHPLQD